MTHDEEVQATRQGIAALIWSALELQAPEPVLDPPTRCDELAAQAAAAKRERNWGIAQALHSSYADRYHKDNDRSWTAATWLVAVAWALFPASIALKSDLNWKVVVGFGLTSMALVGLWYCIATWHLTWASRSYDLVRALEIVLLASEAPDDRAAATNVFMNSPEDKELSAEWEIRRTLKERTRTPRLVPTVKVLRWLIVGGTATAWVLLGVAVDTGWLHFDPPANQ